MSQKLSPRTVVVRTVARAWHETRAATAIEYGLILALVVIAVIIGLAALGESTTGMWGRVDAKVAQAR